MQTHNVIAKVNVHSLRPVFHRFLGSSRARVMNAADLRGLPTDAALALQNAKKLVPEGTQMYIHRMVPLESTDPKLMNRIGVLCVARENVDGGIILTNTKSMDLQMGVFGWLPQDDTPWYASSIGSWNTYEDTYMDVIWFVTASS